MDVIVQLAVVIVSALVFPVGRDPAVASASRGVAGAAAVAAAAEPARASPAPLGAAGEERHEDAVDRLILCGILVSTFGLRREIRT